ncbi:YciI-like protein [Aliidiomarina indica]|uniref:YciI-like protein n=1 Tax=Aliidiomarina indica TaxID=2749147 RepID=UPI00188EB4FF|nr:YciI-like protein [Aliidiomarina indica]
MHYLLFYTDLADNYVAKREAFRDAHLAHARAAVKRGDLVLGGALAEPVDGAVLLFQGDNSRVAESFAETDPYVLNGLVGTWTVRPWTTVVGADAAVKLTD